MEKRKLLSALLLCCAISAPVFAETGINNPSGNTETISQNMSGYSGTYGGAVYNEGTLNINSNIEFIDNYINADSGGGGAIYNNGGTISGGDGVKFINNGITNREFGDIIVNGSAGGAIASWNGGSVTLGEGAEFTGNGKNNQGNATWGFGGAIYIDTDSSLGGKLTIGDNATFNNNIAQGAGAIYTGVNAEIGKSEFTGNKADSSFGGAIYVYGQTDKQIEVNIDSSKFTNNSAGSDGGAIFNCYSANTTVAEGSEFKNNTSGRNGGAIANRGYADSSDQLTAQITANGTFEGNKAVNGGAVHNSVQIEENASVNKQTLGKAILSGIFKNNSATQNGGAIYNDAYMEISNAEFTGNTAANGGAIYNTADGLIKLENVTVNAASGSAKNDIYNAGEIETSGTNIIASNISGNGKFVNSGTNTFSGNNSGFTGEYSHDSENAVTTVAGTFFGGDSYEFDKGTLNWYTKEDFAGDLIVSGSNTTLNIGETPKEGEQTLQGALTLKEGSSIADTVTTAVNKGSSLTVAGGEATLNTGDTWAGDVALSAGTLTIDGITSNGGLKATDGKLDITNSTLTLNTNDTIASAVEANIASSTTLNVNGATVELEGSEWAGNINLKSGTLTVDELIDNGSLVAEKGTVDIKTETLKLDANSSIADAVTTKINKESTLNIAGGSAVLDNLDTWDGIVDLDNGTLLVQNRTSNGIIDAEDGVLNLENSTLQVGSGSTIAEGVNFSIDQNSIVNIQGGNVALNDGNDNWEGTIVLGTANVENDNSSLTIGLPEGSNVGKLEANNGNLTVLGGLNLDIKDGSYIEREVAITTSGNINILMDGTVAIDDNDNLNDGAKVTLTDGGTLNYYKNGGSTVIEADGGDLFLREGSKLTLTAGTKIDDEVNLHIMDQSTLALEDALNLNLTATDEWIGRIENNNGGTINANGFYSAGANLEQTGAGAQLNLYNGSQITLKNNSLIEDGQINITENSVLTADNANITGGNMTIDENSSFIVKSGTFTLESLTSSNLVDVMNNEINKSYIGTLTADGQADFNIDILARSNKRHGNDQFVVTNPVEGDGIVKINDWSLQGDIFGWDAPVDRRIVLDHIFVDENGNPLEGVIEATDKETFTPIGWYELKRNAISGVNYSLDLVKFNPQVFRGQVATVAQWMNQLAIDDMLFTHTMVLPSFKDENGKMANNYAAINPLFAPYQYSIKDGGLWYKMYGTFEHLQMNNGLNVGNNSYGALVGADFGMKDLKNGWKFMPTAYVGYNGAHQYWSGMGQYQNGGQAGLMGTWYKDNFIVGGLVYGGVYENSMDVHGTTDNTFNYFAGASTKASYNIRLHRDWVLQPNLMAAYNYFGQQNWHSDFGQMGMMAGMLHGVNIAPGVNLIWEKETFSAYATLQYMYNINGACGGRAGNVGLPQVEMERGYIQYGLGLNKKFTDRASGYLQAVLRNVGRTGVGFQAGFNIRLGK